MTNDEREALVARVRYVNEFSNPDAPIARRGTRDGIATLRHGDIDALCDEVERLTRERERVIAGALFDFAGHLTTMDEVYEVGASRDSTRMVAELQAWAKKRNLDLADADVMGWQDKIGTTAVGGADDPL